MWLVAVDGSFWERMGKVLVGFVSRMVTMLLRE
jgi:hypothetical protein